MVIITDLFVNTVKEIASICGIPDYPFAVIPHPISRLGEEELDQRAGLASAQIISHLSQGV